MPIDVLQPSPLHFLRRDRMSRTKSAGGALYASVGSGAPGFGEARQTRPYWMYILFILTGVTGRLFSPLGDIAVGAVAILSITFIPSMTRPKTV